MISICLFVVFSGNSCECMRDSMVINIRALFHVQKSMYFHVSNRTTAVNAASYYAISHYSMSFDAMIQHYAL